MADADDIQVDNILVDFGKICRFCLSDVKSLVSLFEVQCVNNLNSPECMLNKIWNTMYIQVTQSDGFPEWICHDCINQVERASTFIEMCRNSQAALKKSFVDALLEVGLDDNVVQVLVERKKDLMPTKENVEVNNYTQVTHALAAEMGKNIDILHYPLKEEVNSDEGEDVEENKSLVYHYSLKKDRLGNKEEQEIDGLRICEAPLVGSEYLPGNEFNSENGTYENDSLPCHVCGLVFHTETNLATHSKMKHTSFEDNPDETNQFFQCSDCGTYMKTKLEVSQHMKLHDSKYANSVLCNYCGGFFQKNSYVQHLEDVHKIVNPNLLNSLHNFQCVVCFRQFVKHSSMRLHIDKFHKDDLDNLSSKDYQLVWNCEECEAPFLQKQYLLNHYFTVHPKKIPATKLSKSLKKNEFVCKCGQICFDEFDSLVHQALFHENKLNKDVNQKACPLCEDTLDSFSTLKSHLITFHNFISCRSNHECCLCSAEFDTVGLLQMHFKKSHSMQFSKSSFLVDEHAEYLDDDDCQKETSDHNYETYRSEILEVKRPSSYSCKNCGINITTWTALKKHLLKCVTDGNNNCIVCNKSYKSRYILNRHAIIYHRTEDPVKCPACPKIFARQLNLHKHYKIRHLKLKKKCVCSYCGLSICNEAALKNHEDRFHRNIREFKCPECPECFTTKNTLAKHQERHMKDRPMLHCHICEKKYTTMSGIERHIKTHGDKKDFVCDIPQCGKSFYTKNELRRHTKYHNKDFKHVCKICQHRFITPGELKKHSTKHTGARPYKCPVCEVCYSRRDDKVKHLKRVHGLRVKRVYGSTPRRNVTDVDHFEPNDLDTVVIDNNDSSLYTVNNVVYVTQQSEQDCDQTQIYETS